MSYSIVTTVLFLEFSFSKFQPLVEVKRNKTVNISKIANYSNDINVFGVEV